MAQDMLRHDRTRRDTEMVEMHQAIAHYRVVQDKLEVEALNRFATVDAETGDYVIADTRLEASARFRDVYGPDRAGWTLHIGTT
jgi:hypothetical protein